MADIFEAPANDENVRPSEPNAAAPSDRDRARFGFKKRPAGGRGGPEGSPSKEEASSRAPTPVKVHSPRMTPCVSAASLLSHAESCHAPGTVCAAPPTAAASVPGSWEAPAPLDLLALCDSELGDPEPAQALLRLKPRAGRYDFKDQIEELKNVVRPLKEALGERLKREAALRDTVSLHQSEIRRHLAGVDEQIARQTRLLEEKLARERTLNLEKVQLLRNHVLETEKAWQKKELVQECAVAERDRQTLELHAEALEQVNRQLQDSKEDFKRQLAEASQLLQSQIDASNRLAQDLQEASAQMERCLVAEWSAKLAALTSEKAAELERTLADFRAREETLKSEHELQVAELHRQKDEAGAMHMRQRVEAEGAHREEVAQLVAKQTKLEADLRAELERTAAEAQRLQRQMQEEREANEQQMMAEREAKEQLLKADHASREQQMQADFAAKFAELDTRSQQRERELVAEASGKLGDAVSSAQRREQELASKIEQLTSKLQTSTADSRIEFEAAASAARRCDEELRAELKASTFKAKTLGEDLSSARDRFDAQEQRLQQEILQAGNRIRRLEGEQATERSTRDRESIAKATLQGEHRTLLNVVAEQRSSLQDLQRKLATSQERGAELHQEVKGYEVESERLRDAVAEEQARLQKQQEELDATSAQLASTREDLAATSAELAAIRERSKRLSCGKREIELEFNSYREHNSTSNTAQMQAITDLRVTVDKLTQKVDLAQMEIGARKVDIDSHQTSIRRLEEQLALAEGSRRDLHNTIQELRGNIRVMCRVRPGAQDAGSALVLSEDNKLALSHGAEAYNFGFDKVFGPSSAQEDLFAEVSGLVQSALDGYKVCIFAYGQTGSGKTFTMQGGCEPSSWGLIPRSLRQIFSASEQMRLKGWQWTLKASFMEVYNEVIRDLLREDPGPKGSTSSTPQCHTIKHDADWGMMVTNMTCVQVSSIEHINALTTKASKLRAVGSTDMNSVSSRSHSIFALYLSGSNQELNSELRGALHLVDLAGSERLDRSGAVGDRLKETQNINRSLSSLADVFLAKAEGRSHIPFRNSKLTHLMEPCLSGQGKTLMAVNVGPEEANSHESLCSLRFASQVSQCTTGGKPKRAAKTLGKTASTVMLPTAASASRRGGC